MDSDSEAKLISLISQLMSIHDTRDTKSDKQSKFISLLIQIISHVRFMDLDSQPKPKSKLMLLIEQTISLFNSMNLDSQPKPLLELISLICQLINDEYSNSQPELDKEFLSLVEQTLSLEPEPELMPFIHQILSLVISMNSKWTKLISLSPQVEVKFEKGEFHVIEKIPSRSNNKWRCLPLSWKKISFTGGEEDTHFVCRGCYGKNYEGHGNTMVEIKHPLHPKHSLQLVLLKEGNKTRKCYCCDEDLIEVFYYCSACDFAMNIACVEKPPVLSIDHPKWHEHTLAHFPRDAPITCNLCALADLKSSHIYMCPPCDLVVHKSCLKLPRVIRISRHPHRISFTFSFSQGDWVCRVCRRKMDNDYGGYSCTKKSCSYAAHSKCATQTNVWDGKDLEGVSEEIEEEVEPPFVRISDGIIEHFSHEEHHLRLDDEDKGRDYDENKLCQACITPIYFGNFYSCMQCNFILHEACANLSRIIYHPIHPHMLILVKDSLLSDRNRCAACSRMGTFGFFYICRLCVNEGCHFMLDVQCATTSEPVLHGSHMHHLFQTSKPGEERNCSVCECYDLNTFNCIERECNFALCFKCGTIPEKVRYKHDKHMLTLSYGRKETGNEMYWCEACERKIDPTKRFYKCDEYCRVTLHIECLIGRDLYMKPGSSLFFYDRDIGVLPNNHHMSRPICSFCKKRCPYKVVFKFSKLIACSIFCPLCPN